MSTEDEHPKPEDRFTPQESPSPSPVKSLASIGVQAFPFESRIFSTRVDPRLEPVVLWVRNRGWSGRGDLNSRPLGPEPSALPGCATPRLSTSKLQNFYNMSRLLGQENLIFLNGYVNYLTQKIDIFSLANKMARRR